MSGSAPTELREGDEIPLRLQLWDGAVDKYVRAFMYADGTSMSGSPFELPHFAQGKYTYKDAALTYPTNIDEVCAIFIVYNNNTFTEESKCHERSLDIYRTGIDADIAGSIDEIKILITELITLVSNQSSSAEIVGLVDAEDLLIGSIFDDEILGLVTSDEIEGLVSEGDEIYGYISESDGIVGITGGFE